MSKKTEKIFISSHNGAVAQHDNSKLKQCPGGQMVKMQFRLLPQQQQQKKTNTTNVLSCIMFVQILYVHRLSLPNTHIHTHIQGSSSLLKEWRGVWARLQPAGPETADSRTVSKGSQSETRVVFISPVQSSWLLFHISTASTFLL